MEHQPITLKQFVEAYVRAHYCRPDGRNEDIYKGFPGYDELLDYIAPTPYMVKSFSFTYFRGLSEFPYLDLKTTVTTDMPNTRENRAYLMGVLDLSNGECSLRFEFLIQSETVTCIITEVY